MQNKIQEIGIYRIFPNSDNLICSTGSGKIKRDETDIGPPIDSPEQALYYRVP